MRPEHNVWGNKTSGNLVSAVRWNKVHQTTRVHVFVGDRYKEMQEHNERQYTLLRHKDFAITRSQPALNS